MRLLLFWAALPAIVLRPVGPADIDSRLSRFLPAEDFQEWVRKLDAGTGRRVAEGERDHLIYYVLQSGAFTRQPPIEPALSAREFTASGEVPAAVVKRVSDFLRGPASGKRMQYLSSLLPSTGKREFLYNEYRRTMQFLYEKEFASRSREGQERRDFVAQLYQTRGHSTDSQWEANFAVHAGLSALRGNDAGLVVRRVLIIGPGQDFSPRTKLREETEPQVYQPYAIADSLLETGLSRMEALEIDCADINPRVVQFIEDFARREQPELQIHSTPGEPEHEEYFRNLGRAIGERTNDGQVAVRPAIASRVRARNWNIVTQLPASPRHYDLIVATNVLLYFSRAELLLAVNNVSALLRPGGYFLHNDLRPEMEEFTQPLGMPTVDGRFVRLPSTPSRRLYDSFVLHRKAVSQP